MPDYMPDSEFYCEIEVIYLEPWARGMGLGQDLISRCLQWAQEKKISCMKTGIFAQKSATLKFFRKNGFRDYHSTLIKDLQT